MQFDIQDSAYRIQSGSYLSHDVVFDQAVILGDLEGNGHSLTCRRLWVTRGRVNHVALNVSERIDFEVPLFAAIGQGCSLHTDGEVYLPLVPGQVLPGIWIDPAPWNRRKTKRDGLRVSPELYKFRRLFP